jgi:hypothetical protein
MGLLIKLQNGDTTLKSLKFGHDRPGGGDSGQPYIKTPINKPDLPALNSDFLLRGGISAPLNALEDVARLTKYFFDFRNPSGLLFTAKQNLLSRVSPKTEASRGIGYAGGLINAGVYTPLSTIAEAGVVAFGGHLNKQGIDPTGLIPSLSVNKYQDIIISNQFTGRIDLENNRLVKLTQNIIQNEASGLAYVKNYFLNAGNSIISYGGGSDSILGIGNTNIRFATDNAGVAIKTLFPSFNPKTYQAEGKPASSIEQNKFQIPVKATEAYIYSLPNVNLTSIEESGQYLVSEGRNSYQYNFNTSVYKGSGSLEPRTDVDLTTYLTIDDDDINAKTRNKNLANYVSPINQKLDQSNRELITDPTYDDETGTFYSTDLNGKPLGKFDPALMNRMLEKTTSETWDYKKSKNHKNGYLANLDKNSGYYYDKSGNLTFKTNQYPRGIAPDFRVTDRKTRGFNDYVSSESNGYTYGGYDVITKNSTDYGGKILDKIYYDSSDRRTSKELLTDFDDLIEFNFTILDPSSPSSPGTVLDFRAYIDSFSDSYNNDWKSQTYMGRAEKQYKYNSFDRSISLGFTIVADNEKNLGQMYSQLNTLASSIAPSYTSQGYMAGVLHKLTVGNYIYKQYGILQGLTFEITDETPWQIDKGNQLPLYIKVTGIKFVPIHVFRPQVILDKEGGNNVDYNVPVPIDKQSKRYIYQTDGKPNGKPNE